METAPAPHQKAGRHGLLWLTGLWGTAQPAAPGCQGWGGHGQAQAGASPHHLPAFLLACPILCHSASQQTPGVGCVFFGGAIASPALSACVKVKAGAKQSWRRLTEENLSFTGQKALLKPAQQCCRFHSPEFCKAAPRRSGLWQGWKKGALARVWELAPEVRHHMAGEALALMLGVIRAPRHQGRLWDRGDGGCSNSCRK